MDIFRFPPRLQLISNPNEQPQTKVTEHSPNSSTHYISIVLLSIFAFITRFYRLSVPAAVVFDELHFSKFVDRVLTRTWFFDIHPPLGKLILAYSSYLFGYRPEPSFVIEKIGNEYPKHVNYVIVRAVSASFSTASVPLTYMIARNLNISHISSLLAAASVLFDFLSLIEGRLILTDSQLLFFCQLALYCALHLWKTAPKSMARRRWLFFTGLTSGAALSVKHTALATPGLIAVISFFGIHFLANPLEISECVRAALYGFTLYALSFYVMFKALIHTGGRYDKFMPMHFRKTLIGATEHVPEARRAYFPRLFIYLNQRMIQSNASIKKRHTWESDWYQWIVNWRGVLYYVKYETDEEVDIEYKSEIYLLGNPVVIYLTLLSVVIFLVFTFTSVRYRERFSRLSRFKEYEWIRSNGTFLLFGWLCNLLPYILVERAAFIYHYLPGLFYGQLLTSVLFDLLPSRARNISVSCMIALMFAAFVYWSAWIYGFPMTREFHSTRRWLPRWT